MREDPIVLEDWKVQFMGKSLNNKLNAIELAFSLSLSSMFLFISFSLRNSIVAMLWGLYLMYVIIMEGYLRFIHDLPLTERYMHYSTTIIFIVISLEFLRARYSSFSKELLLVFTISGFILIFKGLLILFYRVNDRLNGDLLYPNSEYMSMKLKEQYALLEGTSYRLLRSEEIDENIFEIFKEQGRNVALAFLFSVPLIILYLYKWFYLQSPQSPKVFFAVFMTFTVFMLLFSLFPILFSLLVINIAYGEKINQYFTSTRDRITNVFHHVQGSHEHDDDMNLSSSDSSEELLHQSI